MHELVIQREITRFRALNIASIRRQCGAASRELGFLARAAQCATPEAISRYMKPRLIKAFPAIRAGSSRHYR